MSSPPTSEVSPGQRPVSNKEAVAAPPRCTLHVAAASGAQRDQDGRFKGEGVRACPACQTLLRSHRRRVRRKQERELARRVGDPRQEALDRAQQVLKLADGETNPQIKRMLHRAAAAYSLLHVDGEHKQRMAVLKVLEKCVLVTLDDIVGKTLLPAELVKSFLDEWAEARVDLVFITTKEGRRKSGRNGTVFYYGLNR